MSSPSLRLVHRPATASGSGHPPLPISEEIQGVIDRALQVKASFESLHRSFLDGTRGLLYDERDGYKFFGISQGENQNELDFTRVRSAILDKLGLPAGTQIVQLIGGKGEFLSRKAQHAVEQQIEDEMNKHPPSLFVWDFIGNRSPDLQVRNVNDIINDLLDGRCRGQVTSLAILADHESLELLRRYPQTVCQNARNFYLVYGDAKLSDTFLSADSITDEAICYEGKVESLCHIVNLLERDVKVTCVYNLRGPHSQFSTSVFMKRFVDFAEKCGKRVDELTDDEAKEVSDQYINELMQALHSAGRVTENPDLLGRTISAFMTQKLWTKLGNCCFKQQVLAGDSNEPFCVLL